MPPAMTEQLNRPKAIRGLSGTNCIYSELCKAKALCGRIRYDLVGPEVPVASDTESLLEAEVELRLAMEEWGNVAEPDCTRKDNYLNGEPVTVFRVGSYLAERVY